MEKIYLDYNATSPLADSVAEFMKGEALSFANANALYQSGKQVNSKVNQSIELIRSFFKGIDDLGLFFHSGASEGISTFFNLAPNEVMVYFESDHPAVHAMAQMNKKKGATVIMLPIENDGTFNEKHLIQALIPHKEKNIYLNYTYVHNETGAIWPIDRAVALKEKLNCFIHVDCAQIIGKIPNWNKIEPSLDLYTFSSHKFGGLKGVGFSLVNKSFPFRPLIPGGGQQQGFRGGTLNSVGVITTALALKTINDISDLESSLLLRKKIEKLFENSAHDRGFVVLKDFSRAVNTMMFCFKDQKGDFLQTKFDMFGIEVSYGSACSSGSIKGSQTMNALGFEDYSNNLLRVSFGPKDSNRSEEILTALEKVLKTL